MSSYLAEAKDDTPDDEYVGGAFVPRKFAMEEFALRFTDAFDEFIELRVLGEPRDLAAIEAFQMIRFGIDLKNAEQIGMACEANPYVKRRFREVLATKDIKRDLWTERDAVNQLLRMVKDTTIRAATRLNAISQLNHFCKYVELDEVTARRVDRTIAEFQRQHEAWMAAGGPSDSPPSQATAH